MAILTDIKSTTWQPSFLGAGNVVEGLADIRQCIDIILRTQKGTDALRPEFGSNIYQYIDQPVNTVIPNVKRAIIEAIQLFEPRVEVVSITHILEDSRTYFFITYGLVDTDFVDKISLYVSNSGFFTAPAVSTRLILEGLIPAYGADSLLKLRMILDEIRAVPIPPSNGFISPAELYTWVIANWSIYGTWYLLADRLVGYITKGIATTGSITITTAVMYKYAAAIPALSPGMHYRVSFIESTSLGVEYIGGPYLSIAEMLGLLTIAKSDKGIWDVESLSGPGDFDPGSFIGGDYNTINNNYLLVLYTSVLPDAILTVSAV